MILKFLCPKCGQKISVETPVRDTGGMCPGCHSPVTIPFPAEPPPLTGSWLRFFPYVGILVIVSPGLYYGFIDGLGYLNLPHKPKTEEQKFTGDLQKIVRQPLPSYPSADALRLDSSDPMETDPAVKLTNDFFRDYAELLGNLQRQLDANPREKLAPETLPKDRHTAVLDMGRQGKRVEVILQQQKVWKKLLADTRARVQPLRATQNAHIYALNMVLENATFSNGIDLLMDYESTDYLLRMDLAGHFDEIHAENGKLVFAQPKDRQEYDNNLRMRAAAESRLQQFQKTALPQIQAAKARLKTDFQP